MYCILKKKIKDVKNVNSCAVASTSSTYNHNGSRSNPSHLRTATIPRKSPRKQKIGLDELVLFQAANKIVDIDSISELNSPENCNCKRLDNSVQLFNLNVMKKLVFLQFTNVLVQIEISMFVCHMV